MDARLYWDMIIYYTNMYCIKKKKMNEATALQMQEI